ncbi:alpha/beta fold hydrolase [Nocardia miyunensis]|uniref:alpha/beta fold hydrolase n=1 Tax=Nocardia miyunensis TaxID=282684 RepID=UPI00082B0B94|nr:alpha/beta hydrolase [Nocardia miyunensis]
MTLTAEGLAPTEGLLSRWVRLPSGVKAHYVTAGETGPAVVLLHGGLPGSSGAAGWTPTALHLARNGFRVYAPDMPAFGLTEDDGGFYQPGPSGHDDFIHDLTTALCLDRFFLAGNSMGTRNAVNYLLAHPERVERFVLVAGPVGDIVSEEASKKALDELGWQPPPMIPFEGTEESMEKLIRSITYNKTTLDPDVIAMRTFAANRTADAHKRHTAASFGTPSPEESARFRTAGRLDHVTIPGIYLYGVEDTLLPVQIGYLQEDALPNIQFFYPERCGHQGQTDRPEVFNAILTEYFRDGVVSSSTAELAGVSKRRPVLPAVSRKEK